VEACKESFEGFLTQGIKPDSWLGQKVQSYEDNRWKSLLLKERGERPARFGQPNVFFTTHGKVVDNLKYKFKGEVVEIDEEYTSGVDSVKHEYPSKNN